MFCRYGERWRSDVLIENRVFFVAAQAWCAQPRYYNNIMYYHGANIIRTPKATGETNSAAPQRTTVSPFNDETYTERTFSFGTEIMYK